MEVQAYLRECMFPVYPDSDQCRTLVKKTHCAGKAVAAQPAQHFLSAVAVGPSIYAARTSPPMGEEYDQLSCRCRNDQKVKRLPTTGAKLLL